MQIEPAVINKDVLTGICTVSKLTKRNEKNGILGLTLEVFNQNSELVLTNINKCKPAK